MSVDAHGEPTPLRLVSAGDTHIGGREHNEDSVLLRPDLNLYMVADGAGGHNAGNVASLLATGTVAHHFESTLEEAKMAPPFDDMGLSWGARRLATAFQRANLEVIEIAQASESKKGMGTTLVAAYFDLENAMMVLGHVGDSRCYRLRDGRLERLTTDHTLINDVLEMRPDIDRESAAKLPRNVITNALGMDPQVRVSVRTHELAPGDRYLLCSDGLTDEVDDGQLQQGLQLASSPEEAVRLLIDLATDGQPRDNVAVVSLACRLAPGVAKLPESPVPPRRRYPDDAVVLVDGEEDEEIFEVILIDADEEDFEEAAVPPPLEEAGSAAAEGDLDEALAFVEDEALLDEDDDDGPVLEIVEERASTRTERLRRRRPDETVITKNDKR
ncbi:MAG: PP2C family serine/threonine-protein phosphatase [Sandaracinaceae bacterium]